MEPLRPGAIVDGRFRVQAVLGRGATSVVYAVIGPPGDELALKRVTRATRSAELSLRREYQTLARLAHPSIVSVRELGRDGEVPYYTMERIGGPCLDEAPRPAVRDACVILRDLASALSLLHARRLVHRDVSARNVRLGTDGAPKLLDFGTLATMGVGFDVAGTPSHVAPETLRRLPVDGRADIYGLGALGYFLLARRHAYPATRLADLERAWQTPPPKLRTQCDDVPEPLEALILSMLSIDPLGRPVSAAEVMDRLAGIASIEHDHTEREEEAWMQGAVLVGREREASVLRDALREVARGRARTALVEAQSGLGKTRLLQEAALDAQLVGAVALRARGDAAELGPFGVLRALAAEAMRVCPSESIAAARGREDVIASAVPELSGAARHDRATAVVDPNESRLRLQQALLGWFRDLARARPVVVLLDDVQRCDEASAALLAALARSTEAGAIGIFAALRVDEAIRAPEPIAALREAATQVALGPLGREETVELVTTWFGDLPERERLADYLLRRAGGSPLHTIELVRFLRERRILEYRQGSWRLARELPESDLPARLAETLSMRVRALGNRARRLGEALAVHAGTMSLELCVGSWEGAEDEALGILDELVFEEILVGSADELWFRHDGLREAFLRALSPSRLEELHRRAADVLLSLGSLGAAEREAQIGWHLLHGGRRLAASNHLARAGRDLYEAHSFREAIAPLRAACRPCSDRPSASPSGSPGAACAVSSPRARGGCLLPWSPS